MLALEGYYDGNTIQTLEKLNVKKNQRVIITILDEFIKEKEIVKINKKTSARGILSQYSNPSLIEQEEGAWKQAMVEKHENA